MNFYKRSKYYVDVLKSMKDDRLYYGLTANIKRRLEEHNNKKVSSTKNRAPFELLYYEIVNDIVTARKKERYFKSGFGRKYIKNKIKTALSSIG